MSFQALAVFQDKIFWKYKQRIELNIMGAGASSGRRGSVLISPRAEAMSTKNENGVSSSRSSFCQN